MSSDLLHRLCCLTALLAGITVQAQDLHMKKNVTVAGNVVSSTETSIKGARERNVTTGPSGTSISLRQCDLKRTVTINEQSQAYFVSNDPQDENAARAAALATGAPANQTPGGKIVVTTTLTDTGERKTMHGYQARHLKAKVVQEPSPDACAQGRQTFDIDGWFADLSKEQAACAAVEPAVQQGAGCNDKVIARRLGNGKPGYPLQENITMQNPDGGTTTVGIQIVELSKKPLPAELFDVPAGYRQVNSLAELSGPAPQSQVAQQHAGATQPMASPNGGQQSIAAMPQMATPTTGPAAQFALQQQAMAQIQQAGMAPTNGMNGMSGSAFLGNNQAGGASTAAPQALGPKAAGKIRIGVAPPEAQVGQGSNAGADYSTPIRNAEIALMNGPAVEVAPLDSRVAMQLQAEAQQKQCDFILVSSVSVKHGSGGGFGKFMKMAAPVASMAPMAGMGGSMGGAVAAQAAGAAVSAAAMSAQQQAINQLAGFNGQIKSKDDVTVNYQLLPTGQSSPITQNSLKGKAKSDGEDVLTPLLQQAASNVLTAASKK